MDQERNTAPAKTTNTSILFEITFLFLIAKNDTAAIVARLRIRKRELVGLVKLTANNITIAIASQPRLEAVEEMAFTTERKNTR
jgi:hypothetical protein